MLALTVLLGLALVDSIILAVFIAGMWRIFWTTVALAIIIVVLTLMWPGNPLNRYWFPPHTGGDNGPVTSACANSGDMIERDVLPNGTNSLVCGPAIYEQPGVIGKVNVGETVTLTGYASWWSFGSQASLDSRWPSHLREFLAKCTTDGWNCVVNGPKPETDVVAPAYVVAVITAPTATTACANLGDLVERDILAGGENNLVCGPAIYEQPGVVGKVDAGTTVPLTGTGSWWSFPSQNALNERWPDHLAEWLAKNPTGKVIGGP